MNCHHYAILSICLWGTSYTCTRIAMDSYSGGSMGLVRNVVGSLVLLAIVLPRKPRPPERRDWLWFGLSGFTGLGLYMVIFNEGTLLAGAATSGILIATAPIITAVLAWLIFRERIRLLGWAAIALAFAGIVVMTLWRGTVAINAGVFWLLGASVSLSFYFLVQRRLSQRYDTLAITTYSFVASVIPLLIYLPESLRILAAAPLSHTLIVLYMGVFPSALGYLFWVKALSLAPKTSVVTNYMFVTPILVLLFDYAVTGVPPDAGVLVGGPMVLAGLVVFSLAGKGSNRN